MSKKISSRGLSLQKKIRAQAMGVKPNSCKQKIHSPITFLMVRKKYTWLIPELQSAKRTSGAPWVRKFSKPMKPKKIGYQVSE